MSNQSINQGWPAGRALAMFRDCANIWISTGDLLAKWTDLDTSLNPAALAKIAVEALGDAAAEITMLKERLLQRDAKMAELCDERDAYRKAKQENDERFIRERDEARAEVDRQKARADAAEAGAELLRFGNERLRTELDEARNREDLVGQEVERQKARAEVWKGQRDEVRAEVERLKAELAKAKADLAGVAFAAGMASQQQPALLVTADEQPKPKDEPTERCGAWGGCPLPAGHNMGNADIPENHQRPEPLPSDEEIRDAINKVEWVGTIGDFAQALRMVARRASVQL